MKTPSVFAIKGNIIYTPSPRKLEVRENSCLICENGIIKDITTETPENITVYDSDGGIIIPGMTDLHIHAPQYTYRAIGMDMELLDWLDQNAFPEEGRYADKCYAEKAYSIFANDIKLSPTTRAVVFSTIHTDATLILMDKLEKTGLITMVGKVNMDRNCPPYLCETAEKSASDTINWIESSKHFTRTSPIITPRFYPSCTDGLLSRLSAIREKYGLPVQSHLSENHAEIDLVKKLAPESRFYGDAYDKFGLFGGGCNTVMAHCVHSGEAETELMLKNGVFIAHCPQSNTNIRSGISPVRLYLNRGLNIGLGTDIAGGASLSMFRAVTDAIQVSKLRQCTVDSSLDFLKFSEAFFMATKGGGAFFGKTGSFEKGFDADILVLSDKSLPSPREFTPAERLQRLIYLSGSEAIISKFVRGTKIF